MSSGGISLEYFAYNSRITKLEKSLFSKMNADGNIIASKFYSAVFSHTHSP